MNLLCLGRKKVEQALSDVGMQPVVISTSDAASGASVGSKKCRSTWVTDITGSRMPGVLVEEFSSDWKQSLRSTKTDAKGRFTLAPVKGCDVYYLQLRMNGFDPLRVRVKIDPK